jgi:8-oxo-dGTP diphosphatase
MIEANSIYGNKIKILKDKFRLRVSGYGIIINEGKILLVNTKSSGKYFFPGGEVEIGETIKEAVNREIWEETGIKVEINEFVSFKENFFYYDPEDVGFQNYLFFYKCKPFSYKLTEKNQPGFDEAEKPKWIETNKLKSSNFPYPANEVFQEIISNKDNVN